MFNWDAGGNGRLVAVNGDADVIKTGQVVYASRVAGVLTAYKIASTGDLADAKNVGIAYVDPTTQSRETFVSDSVTSAEYEEVAVAGNLVVIQGTNIQGMTNQLEDGNYKVGDDLEINTDNATLQLYSAGTKVGKVDSPGIVTTKDKSIRVWLSIGNPG